jgi:hypothetical protein
MERKIKTHRYSKYRFRLGKGNMEVAAIEMGREIGYEGFAAEKSLSLMFDFSFFHLPFY